MSENENSVVGDARYDVAKDPASGIAGMPINLGEMMLRHPFTFTGIAGSQAKVYRPSDEAIRHSFDNAKFMRNDVTVMECLEMRQRAVSLLDWSIEPEDSKNDEQVEAADVMTKMLKKIPRFMQYRENLLHATWYGKYGIQHKWGYRWIAGKMRPIPLQWLPVNGDKIVFRYDDGLGDYRPDQIGIRVGAGIYSGPKMNNGIVDTLQNSMKRRGFHGKIDATDHGLAYFLDTWERPLLALHKYRIEDGEYDDPANAGRIHGLGVRSVIYWTWYQKQETLAALMEYLERSAAGVELWYYQAGNAQSEKEARKAAQERIGGGRNIMLVPRPAGEDAMAYGVDRFEPGMAGADQLKSIITEYFGHAIKRYILGQTLTTEASATGLGSNLADIHMDTFMQIVRYDAMLLEETIESDLIDPIKKFAFPYMANVDFKFRVHTREPDAETMLEALIKAYDMGLKLDAQQIRDLVGAPKPEHDSEVLDRMQMMKAEQEALGQDDPDGLEATEAQAATSTGFDIEQLAAVSSATTEPTETAEYIANGNASENSDRQRLISSDSPRAEAYQKISESCSAAASRTDTNPSEEQRKAGNYRKGRFRWNGLELVIETPKGIRRRPEWPKMPAHYGYIRRYESEADGDHIDVFIGPNPEIELVFVVDQVRESGRFDEHKVVVGCGSLAQAKQIYRDAYAPGWTVGKITSMTVSQFLTWLEKGDSGKPISNQTVKYSAAQSDHLLRNGQLRERLLQAFRSTAA